MRLNAIITAAGRGTRMKSNLQKVLHEIDERPMVYYVAETLKKAGIKRPVVVVGYQADKVKKTLKEFNCQFVYQKKRLGTGHAVMQAKSKLEGKSGYTIILYGDVPFFSQKTLKKMIEIVEKNKVKICMTSMNLDDPTKGSVLRDNQNNIIGIVEGRNATPEQLKIKEKNVGIYLIENDWLWENIGKIKKNPVNGEYYLTDIVEIAADQGQKIETVIISDREGLGVDSKEQLKKAKKYLANGVVN